MKFRLLPSVAFFFLLCSVISHAEDKKPSSISFSGIPAIGFGSDTGFGGGVVGSMYVKEEGFKPYKMAIGLKAYITTKGINSHSLQIDRVKAFSAPLRLLGRLGFFSTIAQNYCGRASDAICEGRAEEHFYQHRFMSFYGDIFARWLLWQDIAKLELMMSYRGRYYLNGDFTHKGPYPGSLYDRDYAGQKTEGFLSTLELGLMLDKRDQEAAPTSGYWLEASLRGGSSLIGSAWDYFGANTSLRFYFPLDEEHRLVVASQSIGDVILGDMPFDALSRIGGSLSLQDFNAIGGQYIGRGIKEQHYVGKLKLIEQVEFRYNFWSFVVLKNKFDLNLATFSDLAMTAWDFSRFTKDMQHLYAGFGSGLRIYWNKNFVIRADLSVSPSENFSPKFYLVVGNVF